MQITIDAGQANPVHLRLTAAILTFIAAYKENPATAGMPIPPIAQMTGAAPAATGEAPQGDSTGSQTGSAGASDETALLDAQGEKWNGDIHTANQSKNTDGTWRRKRTAKGSEAPAPRTVEPPKNDVPPPPAPTGQPTVEPAAVVPPAPQVPPAPNAAPPAPPTPTADSAPVGLSPTLTEFGGDTFQALVKYATSIVGAKKVTTDQLLATCVEVGVPDLHACSKPENAHLIPMLAEALAKRVAK